MPNLNEFLSSKNEEKPYNLEQLSGIRACSTCDEDVVGALWDPIDLVMSWECSKSHKTTYKVN